MIARAMPHARSCVPPPASPAAADAAATFCHIPFDLGPAEAAPISQATRSGPLWRDPFRRAMSDHGAYSTDRGPHDPPHGAARARRPVIAAMSPPPPRRALLLINPHARLGAGPHGPVRDALAQAGIDAVEKAWPERDGLPALIRAEAPHYDLAILGGGDGTLNEAAATLADLRLPLGILPLGTANDFARTLAIPADAVAAARLIGASVPRPVDLGEVNGHLFLNVANIGFGADLARRLSADLKRRFGVLGYGLAAARLMLRARTFTAYIEHDDAVEHLRTLQVSVGNGRHYGGGLTIADDAAADDGNLDFLSLQVDHWWRILPLLPALRRGATGTGRDVRAFRTRTLVVRTRTPRPVSTDGELVTYTPAVFTVRPGALLVHAPCAPLVHAPHAPAGAKVAASRDASGGAPAPTAPPRAPPAARDPARRAHASCLPLSSVRF